jgi:hypothetical protein
LVKQGALVRDGERRHARYHLAISTRKIAPVMLDEHGNFD